MRANVAESRDPISATHFQATRLAGLAANGDQAAGDLLQLYRDHKIDDTVFLQRAASFGVITRSDPSASLYRSPAVAFYAARSGVTVSDQEYRLLQPLLNQSIPREKRVMLGENLVRSGAIPRTLVDQIINGGVTGA
jgi:hypothetical protein